MKLNKTTLTQFSQECKDKPSRDAETVHFATWVLRTVAYSYRITVTLLFSPHPGFNPVLTRASISGFSVLQFWFQLGLHYNFSLHSPLSGLTDLVSPFKQHFCCKRCYSTKKPNPSILSGTNQLLQQYKQILPEGKGFSSLQSPQQEGTRRAMFFNNTSSERQTEKKHIKLM